MWALQAGLKRRPQHALLQPISFPADQCFTAAEKYSNRPHLQQLAALLLQLVPLRAEICEHAVVVLLEHCHLPAAADYALHLGLLGFQSALQAVHLTLEALLFHPAGAQQGE